jgi:hypothetical protein
VEEGDGVDLETVGPRSRTAILDSTVFKNESWVCVISVDFNVPMGVDVS